MPFCVGDPIINLAVSKRINGELYLTCEGEQIFKLNATSQPATLTASEKRGAALAAMVRGALLSTVVLIQGSSDGGSPISATVSALGASY